MPSVSSSEATSQFPLECFKQLPPRDRREVGRQLCVGATSPLPISCWKSLSSLPGLVRKVDPADTLSFCQGVQSASQHECVHSGLKKGRMSLVKAIAACQDMPVVDELGVAPASDGDYPGDPAAVRMCQERVSSSPLWSPALTASLCRQVLSPRQVEVVVQCAIDVLKSKVMTAAQIAEVCHSAGWLEEHENFVEHRSSSGGGNPSWSQRGRVSSCVERAFREITTSSSVRTPPDPALVTAACSSALTSLAGSCIASFSNRRDEGTIAPAALLALCSSPRGLSRRGCLKTQRGLRPTGGRGPSSLQEVQACLSLVSHVQSLRLAHVPHDGGEVMAGRFFSLSFEMIDQVTSINNIFMLTFSFHFVFSMCSIMFFAY